MNLIGLLLVDQYFPPFQRLFFSLTVGMAHNIKIDPFHNESELPAMIKLIENDLSEPYSIYTYRYFLHNWPSLSFLARDIDTDSIIGVVISKLDTHRDTKRGYIAMLAVHPDYRKKGIGKSLVQRVCCAIRDQGSFEVVLETEITNVGSLRLYTSLGFLKDKRLAKYYLNGVDAFRLKLLIKQE